MADKIGAADLIADFGIPLAEEWGYIWGKSGQVWTRASQDAATRDMTKRYGAKWIGRKVADCSGLFVWAYKRHGLSIYHGSDTIYRKYTTDSKSLVADGILIRPGAAVFQVKDGRRTHIGLYIGGGKCIEAKGTQSGVVQSDISTWDEWAELADVDYTGMPQERISASWPTLRQGDTGQAVEALQTALGAHGDQYRVKVDGIFGRGTLAAVRAFQGDNGLTPDGIVGKLTWGKLRESEDDDEDKPTEDETETADPWDSMSVEDKLDDLNMRMMRLEGGDTHGESP